MNSTYLNIEQTKGNNKSGPWPTGEMNLLEEGLTPGWQASILGGMSLVGLELPNP